MTSRSVFKFLKRFFDNLYLRPSYGQLFLKFICFIKKNLIGGSLATPALKSGGRDACGIDQSECPMDCLDQSECPIDCLDQSDIELGGFE